MKFCFVPFGFTIPLEYSKEEEDLYLPGALRIVPNTVPCSCIELGLMAHIQ